MTDFIPIVVEPYPDELLFSWVRRLADRNVLHIETFFKKYFGNCLGKGNVIPIDIRRGYLSFCNALNCDIDKMDLYFQLSTAKYELMFYPQKIQTRILHQITRPESNLNKAGQYFIRELRVCKECMHEDEEKYGEFYIHRSHQLSGICACHKHHTKLYIANRYVGKQYRKQLYDFDNLTEKVDAVTDEDIRLAEYSHELLKRNIPTCAKNLISIIFDEAKAEANDEKLTKKEFANAIAGILCTSLSTNRWQQLDFIMSPADTVKVLMKYFPNIDDFASKLEPYNLTVTNHCDRCDIDYYTTEYAVKNGWGCPLCDHELGEQKLFSRLVKVGGNNEYKLKQQFTKPDRKILLQHKVCGADFWVRPGYFLFSHTRCKCNQRLIRKDAERRIKSYPHFKLIEFNGLVQPATFYHDVCGQNFSVPFFRDFLDTPKCRNCEMQKDLTQEIFEQEVKDVVGDEYTVIGQVTTRDGRVEIRHNKCGNVMNCKVYDFLDGSRCPQCYCKTSDDRLATMLKEYADDRYSIIGHDNYRVILYDNVQRKEIRLRSKRVVQEILRPTPSPILPTTKNVVIDEAITTWGAWYQLCIDFKNEFGHLRVAHCEKYKGRLLGDWCTMQRIAYKRGELSEERTKLLKDIDFVFDLVFYDWNTRFEEYKAYVEETGNYFPPTDCVHNGHKVGAWFMGQRKERKRGRLNPKYEKILLEYNQDFFRERSTWETRCMRMKQK